MMSGKMFFVEEKGDFFFFFLFDGLVMLSLPQMNDSHSGIQRQPPEIMFLSSKMCGKPVQELAAAQVNKPQPAPDAAV